MEPGNEVSSWIVVCVCVGVGVDIVYIACVVQECVFK